MEKIKVIIADDNRIMNDFICSYLENFEEIEVLGCCYSDEEEINMIENLKPEIVITDLVRGNSLSGLEVIKKYKNQSSIPKFLVITAGEDYLIDTKIVDGLIKKPIKDYELIIKELRNIKEQIIIERLPIKKEKINLISSIFNKIIRKLKNKLN